MTSSQKKALVAGAGGFIGSHFVRYLIDKGYWVRGADIKEPEFAETRAHEFHLVDLKQWKHCLAAVSGMGEVYQFAANMGGIGYISEFKAEVMRDNILINTHMMEASRQQGVKRFFFSSSACVYAVYKQQTSDNPGLKETDAYPAQPDNEYGWEKLFTERLCKNYLDDYRFETRVGRFHNIYGPLGVYEGGREKSPAALCRKVAAASDGGEITLWGDGRQTRSYCYIDDCLEGTYRLMHSDYKEPLNIGSSELISINDLADMIIGLSGKRIRKRYDTNKPQGVRGRNSDNTLIQKILDWQPGTPLQDGLLKTYRWIVSQIA